MQKSLVPFTQEDKGLYGNLPLVNTLRMPNGHDGSTWNGATNHAPPGFYDIDQDKWKRKFQGAIKERNQFKKRFLTGRVSNILNKNDNLNMDSLGNDLDKKLKSTKYTGG